MWKYYVRAYCMDNGSLLEKAVRLYRTKLPYVERYEGNERWTVPPEDGQVWMDITGAGDGWADIDEITAEEAEQVKKRLFPEG
ncbi:MAG TPA: hypothetical protein PLO92_09530 [Anaerolineaceae bacterium]|jgi:hypothetical protein|nr:hypothetical protein [Anaerolineaceae bacterium]